MMNNTTRFWLSLTPSDSTALMGQYLTEQVGEENFKVVPHSSRNDGSANILVQRPAGNKSVSGTFIIRSSDSLAQEGQTLVVMKRAKVGSSLSALSLGRGILLTPGLHPPLARVLVVHRAESASRAISHPRGVDE